MTAGDSLNPPAPDVRPSFISRLAHLRFLAWAIADEKRYSDLDVVFDSAIGAVDPTVAPSVMRAIINHAHPLLDKLQPGTRSGLAAAAAELFAHSPADLGMARMQIEILAKNGNQDEIDAAIASVTAELATDAVASLFSIQLHAIAGTGTDLTKAFESLVAADGSDLAATAWQSAALLAEDHSRTLDAITFHQRAADAYVVAAKDSDFSSSPAAVFAPLLKAQTTAAKAMAQLQQTPDQSFVDSIVKNADQWRALERQSHETSSLMAAECLEALGQNELAWRYRTNELAHHPREKAVWLKLAQVASVSGNPDIADHAFHTAFSLEETNATTLLQHARFLVDQHRVAEARTLLEKITTSTWGPDFRNTVSQAKNLLASPPFK